MERQAEHIWDVIVVGGGVVGCAVHRRFTLAGARTLLLERGEDILSGASKANSALLHTGFDAPPDSLELACIKAGYQEFMAIRERMNLPLLATGALVVAWDTEQAAKLPEIMQQAQGNGIDDVELIDAARLYQLEPNLAAGAIAAVRVPGEGVIDPWSAPLAYLTQAVQHGGEYRFRCEVQGASFEQSVWSLQTRQGTFRSRLVINCAGINGDNVEKLCHPSPFQIKPRKGQFLVYDKAAAQEINAIILPVPTAITKGVLLARTIFGNLLLGPTAEEQEDRWHAEVDEQVLKGLIQQGERILPTLSNHAVTATYAGLRPATEEKHYRIDPYPEKQWICVGGIRSTGLTSALGVAQYVESLYQQHFASLFSLHPPGELLWPRMPNLAEHLPRAYQQAGNGGIVCHCERVTRSEIDAAMSSAVPPECLGGLRRRTRLMMGRCNGFFCSHQVAQLTDYRFEPQIPGESES